MGASSKGLQTLLYDELQGVALDRQLANLVVSSPAEAAHIRSLSQNHAVAFLAAPLIPRFNRMLDDDFCWALRYLFLLPPPPDPERPYSTCHFCLQPMTSLPHLHAFSCKGSNKAAATRHALVAAALRGVARSVPTVVVEKEPHLAALNVQRVPNAPAVPEPTPGTDPLARLEERGRGAVDSRGDLFIASPSQAFIVDTSVVYPSITTYPGAGQTALIAGNARYATKIRDYLNYWQLSQDGPFALRPFVMESTGAFHSKAEELIKWLAEQAHPSMGSDADVDGLRSLFTARTRQRLSVALHRGNAFIFRRWYSVCYKGYGRAF